MTTAPDPETTDVFARVACGIDGSDASIETVRQIARLAPAGAEVTLFGVANEDAAVSIGWPAIPIAHATKVPREAITAGIERARQELPEHLTCRRASSRGRPRRCRSSRRRSGTRRSSPSAATATGACRAS